MSAPLLCVVGARPNFMKIAPIMAAWRARAPQRPALLLHTGQHYDESMKRQFFEQLQIPQPDIDLGVGSGSHAVQTAQIMLQFEPVLERVRPAAILVVGDVNSTVACALTAIKRGIPVVHVEAGLRSGDRSMPEEINRLITDQLSARLYLTERSAFDNLLREGIESSRCRFVGNVMIDTLHHHSRAALPLAQIPALAQPQRQVAARGAGHGVVTLHRPANVDDPQVLRRLLETLNQIGRRLPLIFPLHPRTRAQIVQQRLESLLDGETLLPVEPLGYLEMLGLMRDARLVLTDSGGIQEETTALGVPCLTLRENTERPITLTEGTNTLVGRDPATILAQVEEILASGGKRGRAPELWDGHAAERIVDDLLAWLDRGDLPL
ncbi:MAG TPA: UDP-N-acetylglucosamine 2-epimerase (non-hydrolyzing) [Pseudomonadales bacterium]|jgi:UDP-N-acetylglucosamine 2-epimerase (non-hydrolysing)|nr:UDP-N-acetylglucosamine 2-epimerase (non-hydrolyzing) [Pseudomonadales bacterium]HMW83610.1 UDP-N-acetylglucosamine 2-epimerase (non-hydrolyzing) [Pseudomonadales bacterium]HMY96976.1 UDP-N-acetylglucosamine 2-epimerase (non-hydrolyzing) [Pseudomonadales bacterium]HMZ70920.1 UDP-N-acetylglucosamine 2-epimerase (non-hydrolyzing) [Pseudomonadales bacterium]HND26988.1 UDP-N-acetylglucosamine 2-epimerase (non-hydrolyzing) [Pseudomonadales bacterium]